MCNWESFIRWREYHYNIFLEHQPQPEWFYTLYPDTYKGELGEYR